MEIHLSLESEELIRRNVRRGAYATVHEFVERAVFLLHEQESWLAKRKDEIAENVEEGYAAAQRGELIDSDKVRLLLNEKKKIWIASRKK